MLCVLAMLSAEAEKKLEQLRGKALPGVKFSPLHAHITLATWLPEDAGAQLNERECSSHGPIYVGGLLRER